MSDDKQIGKFHTSMFAEWSDEDIMRALTNTFNKLGVPLTQDHNDIIDHNGDGEVIMLTVVRTGKTTNEMKAEGEAAHEHLKEQPDE